MELQAPFQQWGIDFIGEIPNKSSGGHCQILVATNHFTKWVEKYKEFCRRYGITEYTSSPYHPQGNGQAESSNKSILKIIKRILGENKRAQDSKLLLALWADRVSIKKAIGCAPFDLVYGIQARLPQNNLK